MKNAFILLVALLAGSVQAADGLFPRPAELEPAIAFWTRIYTEVDTRSGLIHDAENLEIVYQKLTFPPGASQRARSAQVKSAKKEIKKILLRLAKGKRRGLNNREQQILKLFPQGVSNKTLRRAARNIRFQLGQADKYKEGLQRSGLWRDYIRSVFRDMDLPEKLSALPHVESSFNPKAYSKVGAAGLWQFTRGTGRRFMRIDHVVDERMDPFRAARAAAELLKLNYSTTGTWPLAITAYNHGAAGMRRAKRQLGTDDIATIIKRYRSRTFGFASRNFYVAFLAAEQIDADPEKYFGPIKIAEPLDIVVFEAPGFLSIDAIAKAVGVPASTLRELNLSLMDPVWTGDKYVPKGHKVYIERRLFSGTAEQILASIDPGQIHPRQQPDIAYRVRRGNTLSQIARRFGVSVRELMALNQLSSAHRIRVGQVLRLPVKGRSGGKTVKVARHESTAGRAAATTGPAPKNAEIYRVRRGDTLTKIARRFSVTEQKLMAWNNLRSRHRIYAGQKLIVGEQPALQVAQRDTASPTPPAAAAHSRPAEADLPAVENSVALVKHDEQHQADAESAEPVSAEEAANIAPAPLAVAQNNLSADPSDYRVADDHTIEIQAAETLGHYAEWLEIRASRLRRLNGMRYGKPVVIGKRIRLDFSRVSIDTFEARRKAYHRDIQDAFFSEYHIQSTREYTVRRGDSLWKLAKKKFNVPVWLLRQYNPDLDFDRLTHKTKIIVPQIIEQSKESAEPDLVAKN